VTSLVAEPDWVIFGSGRGSRGGGGNTGVFAGRNGGAPAFTTPGVFAGAIPVRSGGGIGCYSSGGGGGGGGVVRGGGGRIVGGGRRGIVGRGRRRLFSVVVIKADRIGPFVRSASAFSISSYAYTYSSFSLKIADKV
jgi:hypothetical protein